MKRLIIVYIALIPGSIREWVYDDTIKLRQFLKKICSSSKMKIFQIFIRQCGLLLSDRSTICTRIRLCGVAGVWAPSPWCPCCRWLFCILIFSNESSSSRSLRDGCEQVVCLRLGRVEHLKADVHNLSGNSLSRDEPPDLSAAQQLLLFSVVIYRRQ